MPDPSPIPRDSNPASVVSDGVAGVCSEALRKLADQNQLRGLRPASPHGKWVRAGDRQLLNLSSNDYLGLSNHPRLIEAAVEATRQDGVGAGASRLVSGTSPRHLQVEEKFAAFKHAEACLLLPTGYMANLAVLTTLAGPGDIIVLDKLVHASLIDAARSSGAEVRTFNHLNLDRAEQLLARRSEGQRFLVTDSVFSMDGDCADLPALCELADRQDAVLVVDEAHGTGVLGEDGSGLAAAQGVAERIYTSGRGGIVVSTASKALGSLGGMITAGRPVIDLLINKARPLIYSTAVPPAQAAAIDAALEVVAQEPQRRQRLAEVSEQGRTKLKTLGWELPPCAPAQATPILPLVAGSAEQALRLAGQLEQAGILAPAIRPPTVAPDSSRVRLSLRADLTNNELDRAIAAVGQAPR